jgi:acetyl-CoA carboxylase biotin carboxylase subunit
MIKAAAGGGGRDIRTAHEMADVERLLPLASAEAMAALGDGGVYVEKIIEKARHIEVQILGDGKRVLHCFERECSLQRRRQKVRGSAVVYSAAFHQRGTLPFGCGFGRVRKLSRRRDN